MGFYKFTASNAPISQSNYIKTKLKPGKMIPSRLTVLSKIVEEVV